MMPVSPVFRRQRGKWRRRQFATETLELRCLLSSITVTTRFDLVDPHDGVISLREALAMAADPVAFPGPTTIEFDPSLGSGMIHADFGGFIPDEDPHDNNKPIMKPWYAPNSGGQFVIDSNVTIDGSALGIVRIGHERGWAERHRIFSVYQGVTATFSNLVIQGGDSNNGDGAGIWNGGNLTLINSVVGSNYALGDQGGGLKGGGIYNSPTGKLTLRNTHVGEVSLDREFLEGIGVGGEFFATEEASEQTRFESRVYRGHSVVGKSTSDPTQISGNGAYGDGGGIYNDGVLHVLDGSVIRANRLHSTWRVGIGVYNAAVMTISDSRVEDHVRWGENLNTGQSGAGIYNAGTGMLTVVRSTFRGNETNQQGGAIHNAGVLTVLDSTFENNSAIKEASQTLLASPEGGAIYDAGIRTIIRRSTFSGNTAFNGGAIANFNNGDMLLDRVTVANNSAPEGVGGGVYNIGGNTRIINSTIASNSALRGGGLRNGNAATTSLLNTILGRNTTTTTHPDIQNTGTLRSDGHNLIQSSGSYAFANGTQSSDLIGVDPRIGPLGDFGGLTQTVGLLAGSPAIDSGPSVAESIHDYRFQGTLTDSRGGAALISMGGNSTTAGYSFEPGQGLTLPVTTISPDQYSIEMRFQLNSLTPTFKKLIDFKDRTSDHGLYFQGGRLLFFGAAGARSPHDVLIPGVQHHLLLIRNAASSEVIAWVDGVEAFRFTDNQNLAVFDAAGPALHFFTDDIVTANTENAGGRVTRLRLYDMPLDASQVRVLGRSMVDQRELSGAVGRGLDRGAFESVSPTSLRVDTLDDVNDGFYGPGQLSLREAIEWANDLPGADQISFSTDLVRQLEQQPGLLTLSGTQFSITDDLSIYGPGAQFLTLSGEDLSRHFYVAPGVNVEISGMTLTNGRATNSGGAIRSEGNLTLRQVRITGNQAVGSSGGGGVASFGPLTVDSSTIDNNTATGSGGGIWTRNSVSIINSTFSANSATNGGAIENFAGAVSIESSTMTLNSASSLGGGYYIHGTSTLTMQNSIIAGNTAQTGPDGYIGAFVTRSGNHNVIGNSNLSGFVNGVDSNKAGSVGNLLNPLLGKLRYINGPTPVHGLLPGSPAIESANPASFPSYDQRGVARPVDLLPDIGAFEYIAPMLSNPIIVDSLDGDSDGAFGPGQMSLTEAILFTNADPNLTSIEFDPQLFADGPRTIPLVDMELRITGNVVLNGPGADLLEIRSAGNGLGIFDVSYAFAHIRNLKVSGGRMYAEGPRRFGGALNNFHAYTILEGVFLTDNIAEYGGAINNDAFSTLVVRDSTIADNRAFWGGGILNQGVATLTNVTISGNSTFTQSWNAGAGIYNGAGRPTTADGRLTLIHSTITNNTAPRGGGVFSENGSYLTLGNTLIAGNNATTSAADVFDDNVTFTSLGGNIIGSNEGLAGSLFGSDQFGTSTAPLKVLMTDLVAVGDAKMPVHALLPEPGGNKAVNRGVVANGVATDQRGVARPYDGGYDVGAFEIGEQDATAFSWTDELVVDNLSDELDGYYGPGGMSLREAILISNAFNGSVPTVIDGVSYDRIRFDEAVLAEAVAAGIDPSIILTRGGLTLAGNVIIGSAESTSVNGTPPLRVTIDGNQANHVIETLSGKSVRLSDLNITGGRADGTSAKDKQGGGIYAGGPLWLTRVNVTDNFADQDGGGIYAGNGSVQLKDVVLSGNAGRFGGGIVVEQGRSLTVIRSSIFNNTAIRTGGGLINIGPMTIRDSSIYNNTSLDVGGGIVTRIGDGLIENTTISGNTAKFGGGIFRNVGGVLTILNSTITNNTGTTHAGGIRSAGNVQLANTILAGNISPSGPNALNTGTLTGLGHNMFGSTLQFTNGGGTFSVGTGNVSVSDNNTKLGSLGDNGGPTLTHALLPDSPAIDRGSEMYMPLMDQRGFPLVDIPDVGNTIPDIGAYEVQSVSSSSWRYAALNQSQFGPGDALVYGFGFDEGKAGSKVRTAPHFLGFQFDTGKMKFGDIVDGPFGTKWGAELTADFAGRFGFDLGFYINSGSVDVTYDGAVNYLIDADPSGNSSSVTAYVGVNDGSLYTISPKIGAYMDLVLKLDAEVSARAALGGVVGFDLVDIHFDKKLELFSLNRQMADDFGRPLFLDRTGEAVARNSKTGQFYTLDITPVPIFNPGPVVPLFDGDIRYFSLPIQEVVEGVVKAAQKARDKVREVQEGRKAAKELDDANKEVTRSENEVRQQEDRLAKAVEQDKRGASLNARQEIIELAGPEYAAAVAQGKKGDELPEKKGSIQESNKQLVDAKRTQAEAEGKVKKKKKTSIQTQNLGILLDFGQAEGSLLGAQVKVDVGAKVGPATIKRNVGTLQVTLPDVNLRTETPDQFGVLSASTDQFPANSELDKKRQIARAQLDLAPMLPIPGAGRYNVSLGPLSLDITTVSYNVGPQLNVVQDVQARPVKQDQALTYRFFDAANPESPVSVQVNVNGQPWQNGALVGSLTLSEGDRIEVIGRDLDGVPGNDPILVMPELRIGSEFSNDIGLDVDLKGSLEAFALKLSAFGVSVIDIGPLLKRDHRFASFDVGSVFNKTFSLGTQTIALEPFTLFNASSRGRTVATAILTEPGSASNQSTADVSAMGPVPIFIAASLLDQNNANLAYTVLEVDRLSGPQISSVEVLDERLSVSGGTGGQPYRISGFTADMINNQSAVLFAVRFAASGAAQLQTIGLLPVSLSALEPTIGSDTEEVSSGSFQRSGVHAILNNDIDGDGFARPETDGMLLIRHLAGFTGNALVDGVLGQNATRTDPTEIADYIDQLLNQSLSSEQFGNTASSLDFDGDGGAPTALGDGILLARYLNGDRGTNLAGGIVTAQSSRQTGEDIVYFIEVGRSSASAPENAEFNKAVSRDGTDVFGLDGKLQAAPDAVPGSSATAAITGSAAGGSSFLRNGSGGSQPTFLFELNSYGQNVEFDELYLDSISPQNLFSRIAAGSPTEFGTEEHKSLLTDGGDQVTLIQQTTTATLGIDEPVYVKVPDAAGYEYVASSGYTFDSFTIDPRIGGNLLQTAEFDLYLFDSGSGTWKFERLISSADPGMRLPSGNLRFDFGGTPVPAFRLYGLPLPNRELHDSANTAAPVLEISTGLTLAAQAGVTESPQLTMVQLARRAAFGDPLNVTVTSPAFASDTLPVTSVFTLTRELHEALLTVSTSGIGEVPADLRMTMASTSELQIDGHDFTADTLELDLSGGPLRMPIAFFGGFRMDTLHVHGADATLNLVEHTGAEQSTSVADAGAINVQLLEVEVVDLRGTGDINLVVDAATIMRNDPYHRQLIVQRDSGDTVTLEFGWESAGQTALEGVVYDRLVMGLATILIQIDVDTTGGLGGFGSFGGRNSGGPRLAESSMNSELTHELPDPNERPSISHSRLWNDSTPPLRAASAVDLFSAMPEHRFQSEDLAWALYLEEAGADIEAIQPLDADRPDDRMRSMGVSELSEDSRSLFDGVEEFSSLDALDDVFSGLDDLLLASPMMSQERFF